MIDRRCSPRVAAQGEVQLYFAEPSHLVIRAELVDMSATGFRIRHSHATLETGREVHFRFHHSYGRAVVIWNRVEGGEVESGLLIVDR